MSVIMPVLSKCTVCARPENEEGKLFKCTKCVTLYCSTVCQKKDWPTHKILHKEKGCNPNTKVVRNISTNPNEAQFGMPLDFLGEDMKRKCEDYINQNQAKAEFIDIGGERVEVVQIK